MDRPIAPYVTPWTGESTQPAPLTVTASGVAYSDPLKDALARDLDGVLWTLCSGAPRGRPEYAAELHPYRQRTAMEQLLCACCSRRGSRNQDGMLWVLPLLDETVQTRWEGVRTEIPPMCEPCSKWVPRLCQRLRDGHVLLRVREAELIGVRGTLYPRPGRPGPADDDALVLRHSPDERFVVARQAVRQLCDITVVAFAAAAP
ncbi:hypothetical protein [Streptomyces pseudogriseolus]|uniref:hypothetical protein n=1 Tax=Streptomyces pseudogriseolus TaxID=36817 RepID=UPI003FA270D7